MLELMQIINRMMHLEYSQDEIECALKGVLDGEITFPDLIDSLGLEDLTVRQLERLAVSLPNWRSAVCVVMMRQGAGA